LIIISPNFFILTHSTRVGFVKALEYEGGFQNCILRMIEDEEEQRVIMEQLTLYKEQKGHFASKLATQALSNNDPSKCVNVSIILIYSNNSIKYFECYLELHSGLVGFIWDNYSTIDDCGKTHLRSLLYCF